MQGVPVPKQPNKSVAEQFTDPTEVTRTLVNVSEGPGQTAVVVGAVTVTNGTQSVVYSLADDRVLSFTLPTHNAASLGDLVSMVNRLIAEVNASTHINAKLAEIR